MKSAAVSALCLWGMLNLYIRVEASTVDIIQQAAVRWRGVLPCENWDCKCVFNSALGCCCVMGQFDQLQKQVSSHIHGLLEGVQQLNKDIKEVTGETKVAFTARMQSTGSCFGPFNTNVSIPYRTVSLNQGYGFNPALGTFTAPRAGIYSFSFTVFSNLGVPSARIYHLVQLMKDGEGVTGVWEDNREDMEDSGTQTVLLALHRGSQVYVELMSGRHLCGDNSLSNVFSGYLVYPTL